MMFKKLPVLLVSCLVLNAASANAAGMTHNKMDHGKHMMQQMGQSTPAPKPQVQSTKLSEAGNDIFGTIQEVIRKLDANPKTDWSKVDLEALRQHLIDMKQFTVDVEVLSQKDTANGTQIVIRPTTTLAHKAVARAMAAHPAMLKSETGWTMVAKADGDQYTLNISTDKLGEVIRLRALGYIGVMALGNHHQVHHWLMASGANPHGKHKHQ